MSDLPAVRRTDKLMADEKTIAMLARGFAGRLAVVGADGQPYCVPLLYVWMRGEVWLHNSRSKGHLRAAIDHEPRVCFEIDEAGQVFPYGRFECDSTVAYSSVVLFGKIRVVEARDDKQAFCEALMEKYGDKNWDRPKGFFPRLDHISVYAIAPERITGKETPLPQVSAQWPAVDNTKTPDAKV